MKQLGIILDNLLPSQINYYAQLGIKKGIENGLINDGCLFYIEKSSMMNYPKMMVNHISHMNGFKGDLIATSIPSFLKLCKTPIYGEKIYYMYNMEWLMGDCVDASRLYHLYRQEKIIYGVRGETHAKLIKNNFNKTVDFIMPDFDLSKIYVK